MNYNQYIDHTLLKPEASESDIINLCNEAKTHSLKSVCINPSWISLAKKQVEGSNVLICTVIGFPLGVTSSLSKAYETKVALADGADEFDMVINIGALKSKRFDYIRDDISQVRNECKGKILKVILETCLLNEDEIKKACEISIESGADFVKTSTGFSSGGATTAAVKIMLDTVGTKAQVKASGGIRDAKTAKEYLDLGVTRLGTSSAITILNGSSSTASY